MRQIFPISYQPKIEPVWSGKIEQSIRFAKPDRRPKYHAGDELLIFTWSGKPYYSPWLNPVVVPCIAVDPIAMFRTGMKFLKPLTYSEQHPHIPKIEVDRLYSWNELDWLALIDGIRPPTGLEMEKILWGKNATKFGDIKLEFGRGFEGQIVHWDWSKRVKYVKKEKVVRKRRT